MKIEIDKDTEEQCLVFSYSEYERIKKALKIPYGHVFRIRLFVMNQGTYYPSKDFAVKIELKKGWKNENY